MVNTTRLCAGLTPFYFHALGPRLGDRPPIAPGAGRAGPVSIDALETESGDSSEK